MKRTRLTQRRNAADMSIPYPGNVNQPDRKDPSWEQYHTFEQQVNHELPDMRTEWKDNPRDEIGFGEPGAEKNPPTVASIRVAANKAVRIAVLLLGEKVADETIEAQARDLMALSQESMDRTLDRFAQTQKLYAEEEKEEKVEEKVEEKKEASAALADKGKEVPKTIEAPKKAEGEKVEEKKEEKVEEKKAEDKAEEKKEEKVEEKKAAEEKKMPDFIKEKIEEKKEKEEKKDASSKKSEDEKDEKKEEEKEASDDKDEDDKEEEKTAKKSAGEMDIELTGSMDEVASDPKADAQLASLFDDDFTAAEEEDEEKAEKKAKKAGIKKLGGQPKVASTQNAGPVDISSIWNSAPDVSEIFR